MLQSARAYVGNLDSRVDEKILYELMIQISPVVSVHLPRDKLTHEHQGYGFVQFKEPQDAAYAQNVLSTTTLFGKPIKVNIAGTNSLSVLAAAAEVFIGNLDQLVDERLLKSALEVIGKVTHIEIMRDNHGVSRGFAFAMFESFAVADKAIASLNGQYILNRPCTVEYAIRDGKRRGGGAERLLEKMQVQ